MTKKYAIIVAGGSGSRMLSDIPKQFLNLGDRPILVHSIQRFIAIGRIEIVLALPKNAIEYWDKIKTEYFENTQNIKTVEGGATRFQSVKNALMSIPEKEGLVAVHDGVRPFIPTKIIEETFRLAAIHKAVIVAVDSKDSVRLTKDEKNFSIDRKTVKLIQTPQTFDLEILKDAYQIDEKETFTDDASVVEQHGFSIFLTEGSYKNIKITTPEDLEIGEVFLKNLNE
ncbi:2-C-methyl-D-erythritol 4-phosphate cytidylyltransferase [Lacihabitans sp. LS3-19]|uniref:2-C-methyl-D-erythritol 4-phosphate cytidylyltransferase n=1 Tax=Lacihabitans sp. LS3-19 TaxID=2487335 RepID=UPI0020CB8B15|nr:2-C-methyl-D-erythritol 4-phosphate cytidylyltransferase [Lacihabitans sp. LS3-19]MCP9771012.1 2-C-methyl-D-erythritol 4-phosphate cytidylyltransferase [Lacihabitans sp. LS3-19]